MLRQRKTGTKSWYSDTLTIVKKYARLNGASEIVYVRPKFHTDYDCNACRFCGTHLFDVMRYEQHTVDVQLQNALFVDVYRGPLISSKQHNTLNVNSSTKKKLSNHSNKVVHLQ
jgi:hypothetical protein